jgi:tetratricopeptide (TPR) repeat protein
LSSCYYELRDYKKALSYAKKAYKLNPNSPLVLWDYTGAFKEVNRKVFKKVGCIVKIIR